MPTSPLPDSEQRVQTTQSASLLLRKYFQTLDLVDRGQQRGEAIEHHKQFCLAKNGAPTTPFVSI